MTNLDDAYANAPYIPDGADYPARWNEAASAFRVRHGTRGHCDLPYGPSPRQVFDLFLPKETPKGTLVFVHGGYWRVFDKSIWSHLATGAVARGWAVAMPSYDLCPDVTIAMITQQVAAAVTRIAGLTYGPLALAGHSAGGHLVARMLAPGMLHKSVTQRIRNVMPISPLSDLEPLTRTAMNLDFRMDLAMARAESPLLQPAPDVPVSVWVGAEERPVFLDQAQWLAQHWGCDQMIADGRHHFDVIAPLEDADSDMLRILIGP